MVVTAGLAAPAEAQDGGEGTTVPPPPLEEAAPAPDESSEAGDTPPPAEPSGATAFPSVEAESSADSEEGTGGEDAAGAAGAADDEDAEAQSSWTDSLSIVVFVDAYVAAHWTLPDGFEGNHDTQIGHRAYDTYGGPSLSFAGLDVTYAPDPIGATVNLRFGTSVPRLLGSFSGLPEGIQFLKQAFVSWRPLPQFQLDFGEFDTLYGAEVSESWRNPTYTRGSLYNVIQPFYHTGFRAAWQPVSELRLTAIAVNGWNNVADNNDGKSVGVQGTLSLGQVSLALGYMTGPEQPGIDDRFRHLVDVIFTLQAGDFRLWANGDLVTEDFGDHYETQGGGMLAAQYRFIPEFAVALRGEVLYFGQTQQTLTTGTLTVEVAPDPHIVFRLDNRLDVASDQRFVDNDGQASDLAFSSVLGLVAHSD